MAHINGHIPDMYTIKRDLTKKIRMLSLELELANETIRELERELSNIPAAIKEFGSVDLYDEATRETMTLVQKKKGDK